MGKRKERRLAAMSAANRRVKLDLFTEPSGEMGTSAHDEIGGDSNQDHNAGVLTSPSSSGKKLENPLLLLGQYSDDDDLDEDTSKRAKHDVDESSSIPLKSQIQEPTKVGENLGTETDKETANGDAKQESDQEDMVKKLDNNTSKENDSSTTPVEHCEIDPKTQDSISDPSGSLVNGDLGGGWKVVIHEGSNQYYYWNTITGETSWEVPTILLGEQTGPSGIEGATSDGDLYTGTLLNIEAPTYAYAAVDGVGGSNMISKDPGDYSTVMGVNSENREDLISKDPGEYSTVMGINSENGEAQLAYDGNKSFSHYCSTVAGVQYSHPSAASNFDSSWQTNCVTGEQLMMSQAEHQRETNECNEKSDVHSARLMVYSERLMQRLEALNRSGHRLEEHILIMKEIETRLSDCKALSSYGSSLLPFWWHSEAQLKQLESIISIGEAHLLVKSNNNSNVEVAQNSIIKDECSLQRTEAGSEATGKDKDLSSANNRLSSPSATKVQMECLESDVATGTHCSLGGEQEPKNVIEVDSNILPGQLVTRFDSHAVEDVDMDVEMEVDDDISTRNVHTAECSPPLEQRNNPDQSLPDFPPLPSDEPSVPSPPDEEWIPPPPDSEPVPPPPPEEPPAPSFPPPYPDTIPYAPYAGQYSMGYAVPVVEYYVPTAGDIANVGYYTPVESSHLTESQPAIYYEPVVASNLPEGAVGDSSVEPVVYYDVLGVTVPSGPVLSSVESSAYFIESGPISYHENVPTLGHAGSAELRVEPGSSSLLENTASHTSNLPVASISSTARSVGDSLSNGSAVDPLPIAAPKNQSKVVRRKKHTLAVAPNLRSNKKVSSLVDKWKAAKEELHGEEEPENAYEVLEKKHQKEIEEWRARQIASGEVQDNANFLPLGGDWRERVKRKKAKENKEAVQTPAEVVDNEGKQPDLVELSKDLPSGWQAYWDESTKGVYYGNSITSETTWTRPTA